MQIQLDTLCRYAVDRGGLQGAGPTFLFLDELTYATDWDKWLKTFYDESWPIRVAGTSSSTAALWDRRFESGVGRWEEQYLAPYLFSEYLQLIGKQIEIPVGETLAGTLEAWIRHGVKLDGLSEHRRRFLLTGGFPELLIPHRDEDIDGSPQIDDATRLLQSQRTLRNDAVERAIYKDIPQAFGVDNPMVLERLLYTLAGQVTGVLSPVSICQSLGGLSQQTFSRYLSYLERAFLVFTLPNFSGSEEQKQKRGRKLYFVDAAVRNAALQRGLAPLTDPDEFGLLIENMVAGHLHALGQESQVRLYYWRNKNDEIDLIFDHPQSPVAFEIASSGRHHRRGIYAFMSRFPRFGGRCYLVAPNLSPTLPEDNWDKVGTIPLDMLLLAAGAQTEKEMRQRLVGPDSIAP
jgi:predicted AAA+ superfamily ATPase